MTLKYPKPESKIGQVADFIFRHSGLTIEKIRENFTHFNHSITDDVRKLRSSGVVVCADDATYSLSEDAYHHYAGTPKPEEPPPVIVQPRTNPEFRPLKGYTLSHRDDGNRMKFLPNPKRFNDYRQGFGDA